MAPYSTDYMVDPRLSYAATGILAIMTSDPVYHEYPTWVFVEATIIEADLNTPPHMVRRALNELSEARYIEPGLTPDGRKGWSVVAPS